MNTDIPVQVDGEPWLQAPCAITIIKSALKVKTWTLNLNQFQEFNFFYFLKLKLRLRC